MQVDFWDVKDLWNIYHPLPFLSTIVELANGERIFLRSFNSNRIQEFVQFVKENQLLENNCGRFHATGGGAYKYEDLFKKEFE